LSKERVVPPRFLHDIALSHPGSASIPAAHGTVIADTTAEPTTSSAPLARLKIRIHGAVQGVGFRPFVFRVATKLGLSGSVHNSSEGVFIEVEGAPETLNRFLSRLTSEKPARSFIQSLETSWLDPRGLSGFEIKPSDPGGSKTALVLPDIATCPDCLREIFDPANRRYRYPFTNCTHCGPRFSIIESLPYDRARTSMKRFQMCPQCRAEYDDPLDRRFHAQPNACPQCGPQLALWTPTGQVLASKHNALLQAAEAIRHGQIVAVKGLGGFQLLAHAGKADVVRRLRERKRREEKPFAVMFPSIERVRAVCNVSPAEERLLRSPEAPIVLLSRIKQQTVEIDDLVAPGNPDLGVLLPYTPLHHLLMAALNIPVIATSGNLKDEPICIDEHEALRRLGGIADLFLVHDRPIVRHVDDSVARVALGREMVLRRARGYAPLPVTLPPSPEPGSTTILAVGAHLKNTVALAVGNEVFISQHIGDLETSEAHAAFHRVIRDFEELYATRPAGVAADLHPDYLSTKWAQEAATAPSENGISKPPALFSVQHHVAHVLSCMAENEVEPPLLGVAWDGTGCGTDGTVWGGEFFHVTAGQCARVASLRPFRLPGGDKAVQEPRRSAIGLLYELLGETVFGREDLAPIKTLSPEERRVLAAMLERDLNSPVTSSIGRLFDAVAAVLGIRQQTRFEGQAAMELEFAIGHIKSDEAYPLPHAVLRSGGAADVQRFPPERSGTSDDGSRFRQAAARQARERSPHPELILDWEPMIHALLSDLSAGVPVPEISARFHNALAAAVLDVANRLKLDKVVLSGGCFQNRHLLERTVRRLEAAGFRAYWHQRLPPNDGGIALGQVVAARRFPNPVP